MNERDLTGVEVIHIDDDPRLRPLIALMLRASGLNITSFGSPIEALVEVQRRLTMVPPQIDLVLTDGEMPEINGPEVARRVNDISGGALPTVLLSGNAENLSRENPGLFCAAIKKPFSRASLTEGVVNGLNAVDQRQHLLRRF